MISVFYNLKRQLKIFTNKYLYLDLERLIAPLKKAVDRLEASLAKYKDQAAKLRSSIGSKIHMITRKYTSDREHADIACNELAVEIESNEQVERERIVRLQQLRSRILTAETELEECGLDHSVNRTNIIPNVLKIKL